MIVKQRADPFFDHWPPRPPASAEHRMAYQWAHDVPRRQYPILPAASRFHRLAAWLMLAAIFGLLLIGVLTACGCAPAPPAPMADPSQAAELDVDTTSVWDGFH